MSELPEIRIIKSRCGSFDSGFCYGADNPYYTGHYPTKEKAARAAVMKKRRMAAAVSQDDPGATK